MPFKSVFIAVVRATALIVVHVSRDRERAFRGIVNQKAFACSRGVNTPTVGRCSDAGSLERPSASDRRRDGDDEATDAASERDEVAATTSEFKFINANNANRE